MKAWVVRAWGDPDSMSYEDVDLGEPSPELLRIKIEAAAINFFDALMIAGTYQTRPEFPFTPGGEVAGTVVAAPGGSQLAPGDRVMTGFGVNKLGMGGYAAEADTMPMLARRIPDSMSFEDAAAFNVVYQTAYFALHVRGDVKPITTSRPSNAMHLVERSKTSPPTGSKMTSAPFPPVIFLTSSAKS